MPPLRVDEVVPAKSPRPDQISSSITLSGQESKLLTHPAVPRNTDGQRRLFDVLRVGQNTAAAALTIDLLPRFHRRRSPAANATRHQSRTPSPELSTSLHPQLTTGK
uniref:Uncharacterized protein n=1 Tax=Oryza rufipogon TaxID=4529 RepID=A0A0E0Q6N6_ORYRU